MRPLLLAPLPRRRLRPALREARASRPDCTTRGKCLESERRVRHRDVFEEALARVEVPPDRGDGSVEGLGVAGRERGKCSGYAARKPLAEARREHHGILVAAENEQRERARVTADRGIRFHGAGVERRPRRHARILAGDEQRLHGPERASPRVISLPALAIPLGRAHEPLPGARAIAHHEQRQPGGPGRVRELHELPLVELARLPCRIPRRCAVVPLAPVHPRQATLAHDMGNDDWRIRIEVEEEEHATGLLDRLAGDLGSEARELAEELKSHRLAVSNDADTVFVYAATRAEAERAHAVVEAELREHGVDARASRIEHWIDEEDRWDAEPAGETWEEEELDRGFAPWEVRVECPSRQEAHDLAERLEAEGYKPERRFQYLIVGTASREDADALATRLHGEVEPGGELVWETRRANPFAVFGGLGL